MKFRGLKVCILRKADASDPLDVLTVIGAKAYVDGVLCGWKASVISTDSFDGDVEKAMASLIAQILKKPRNPLEISGLPPPDVEVVVADVVLDDGMVG